MLLQLAMKKLWRTKSIGPFEIPRFFGPDLSYLGLKFFIKGYNPEGSPEEIEAMVRYGQQVFLHPRKGSEEVVYISYLPMIRVKHGLDEFLGDLDVPVAFYFGTKDF
jgi:hypothetical protein